MSSQDISMTGVQQEASSKQLPAVPIFSAGWTGTTDPPQAWPARDGPIQAVDMQAAVQLHQRNWLEERRTKMIRQNGTTPLPSAAPTPPSGGQAAASSAGKASPPTHLLSLMRVDDEVATATTLQALGANMNDPASLEQKK